MRWLDFTDGKLIDRRREILKCLALITMLIDHIGMVFFPEVSALRIIGRIAFPLYAWLIATGMDYTRNRFRYLCRLLILAVVSQFGFAVFYPGRVNIIFTFAIALCAGHIWGKGHRPLAFLLGLITLIAPIEYGLYGLLTVMIMRYMEHRKIIGGMLFVLLSCVYCISTENPVQVFAVFALPFILFVPSHSKIRLPDWLWRWFYPVHFVILYGVRLLCVR